ncbi:MAG: phage integrase N-terminal SAM-like domain-containing protein, partial [Chloroflexota bacterium]
MVATASRRTRAPSRSADIRALKESFRRALRAENKRERTIQTYCEEALPSFIRFLEAQGLPTTVGAGTRDIQQEHVQAFVTHLLDNWSE